MGNDTLIVIITYIIAWSAMTYYVYTYLKKPFTLADILFFPSETCIKGRNNIEDIQGVSIMKWLPFVNCIVAGVVFGFICIGSIILSIGWLYNHTLLKVFNKITFK